MSPNGCRIVIPAPATRGPVNSRCEKSELVLSSGSSRMVPDGWAGTAGFNKRDAAITRVGSRINARRAKHGEFILYRREVEAVWISALWEIRLQVEPLDVVVVINCVPTQNRRARSLQRRPVFHDFANRFAESGAPQKASCHSLAWSQRMQSAQVHRFVPIQTNRLACAD